MGHEQKVFQLLLEKSLTFLRTRVCLGKVKSQGGQSVEDAEISGVLSVEGLHAQNAHDDASGYAISMLGTGQVGGVFLPKCKASSNATGFDEALAIRAPVFGSWLDRRGNQAGHIGQHARIG